MSECGELILVGLAAPLVGLVLLAAGVGALVLAGAQLAARAFNAEELEARFRSALQAERARLLSTDGLGARRPMRDLLARSGVLRHPRATRVRPMAGAEPRLLRSAIDCMARASAARLALAESTPLHLVAQTWHADKLARAEASLSRARELWAVGDLAQAHTVACAAEEALAVAAFDSHQRLLKAQETVVANQLEKSLTTLGYQVDTRARPEGRVLWATRNQHVITFALERGGRVQMDMAGFNGVSCHREAERLLKTLAEQGVEVRRGRFLMHGRREGGPLVARLQRRAHAGSRSHGVDQPLSAGERQDQVRRAVAWLWRQQQAVGGGGA